MQEYKVWDMKLEEKVGRELLALNIFLVIAVLWFFFFIEKSIFKLLYIIIEIKYSWMILKRYHLYHRIPSKEFNIFSWYLH